MSKYYKYANPVFYVVTRAGRRTSDKDFWTKDEADAAAMRLRKVLRHWEDRDFNKIEVIKTADPKSIY